MKALVTIFNVISFLLVHAVDSEIPKDLYEKYKQSYNQWQSVKKLWNNSYQYTTGTSSWVGYRTSTTISVLNGEVVGREFNASHHGQQHQHWVENKDQLYSHRKNWGEVQPGTFDNVYSTCLQSLNVSTVNGLTEYFLHFEVDTANHGLLKYCGNTPKDCADDCFSGVSINSLKPYQQHQPSSSTVSTTSKTTNSTGHGKVKKMKKNKKVKKISND